MATAQVHLHHHRIEVINEEEVHVIEIRDDEPTPKPAVLILHGTSGTAHGTRRWRLRLGRHLAQQGYRFYLFDSRGHGYSDGEFEDSTVSKYLEDTEAVLSWARALSCVDASRIGLFGFSLGSAISVLLTHKHPDWIKTIVAYTMPCDMDRGYLWYFERFARRSLDRIYSSAPHSAWIAEFGEYFTKAFLDDLSKHDVKQAIADLKMPLLLIQPDDDDQVPAWVSDQAFALKPAPKQRLDINGTHTMVNEDGWNFTQEEQVTQASLDWFRKHL